MHSLSLIPSGLLRFEDLVQTPDNPSVRFRSPVPTASDFLGNLRLPGVLRRSSVERSPPERSRQRLCSPSPQRSRRIDFDIPPGILTSVPDSAWKQSLSCGGGENFVQYIIHAHLS